MAEYSDLKQLHAEALEALNAAQNQEGLEAWRVRFLGRKGGALGEAMKRLGSLPREERPAYGEAANRVKDALEEAFGARQEALRKQALANELEAGAVDVTLPGRPAQLGHLHLTTQSLRQFYSIFGEMGFQVYEAPDVEWDEMNFTLLNIPPYHPARDMQDTFWVNDEIVMRTHTSPGQIRAMRQFHPEPIRVILPGKVYRYEQMSGRAEHQFYQCELLAVGKNISMTDLIGTLHEFAKKMYGATGKMRVRSSYFPFTEPSIEADMTCLLCKGEGCAICKYTGWLEVGGAGMVHPQVLRNGGYDPDEYSGFAFGMGVERPALLKYGIPDIRYFYANDLRFLEQF